MAAYLTRNEELINELISNGEMVKVTQPVLIDSQGVNWPETWASLLKKIEDNPAFNIYAQVVHKNGSEVFSRAGSYELVYNLVNQRVQGRCRSQCRRKHVKYQPMSRMGQVNFI